MSDLKLGVLIEAGRQRDAAHVAVAPVVAAERLIPGAWVGFVSETDFERVGVRTKKTIGVVDPFLAQPVEVGERFWMLMDPMAVTGIRHDWEHPAFATSVSVKWLTDCAEQLNVTYGELLDKARALAVGAEDYFYRHEIDDALMAADASTFWRHYQNVTGHKPNDDTAQVVEFCC